MFKWHTWSKSPAVSLCSGSFNKHFAMKSLNCLDLNRDKSCLKNHITKQFQNSANSNTQDYLKKSFKCLLYTLFYLTVGNKQSLLITKSGKTTNRFRIYPLKKKYINKLWPFWRVFESWWLRLLYFHKNSHWVHLMIWGLNLSQFNQSNAYNDAAHDINVQKHKLHLE